MACKCNSICEQNTFFLSIIFCLNYRKFVKGDRKSSLQCVWLIPNNGKFVMLHSKYNIGQMSTQSIEAIVNLCYSIFHDCLQHFTWSLMILELHIYSHKLYLWDSPTKKIRHRQSTGDLRGYVTSRFL